MRVLVEQSELDKLEEARVALYALADDVGFNSWQLNRLLGITQPMWHLAHFRYDKEET